MSFSLNYWIGFFIFIAISLVIDIGFLNKKPKALSFKESCTMTMLWFLAASIFCSIIYFHSNKELALEFITGYIIELSLSMDNVFVFILIFSYFQVPVQFQHRVLFWGIIGAIIMRFALILGGVHLFASLEWLFYVFGAFLIYSGYKIAASHEENTLNVESKLLKFIKSRLNISNDYHDDKFVIRINNKLYGTPLLLTLIIIEQTDLIFALDSIPAIIAISKDSFVIFTSNIFAILGLRSLYFLIADLMTKFKYLKFGIGIILVFVGIKMLVQMFGIHIPTSVSLVTILFVLLSSMVISWKMHNTVDKYTADK